MSQLVSVLAGAIYSFLMILNPATTLKTLSVMMAWVVLIGGVFSIALTTNAVRSGIVAGYNAAGDALDSIGAQGSNVISIYGYNMVSTGLNTEAARKAGFKRRVKK